AGGYHGGSDGSTTGHGLCSAGRLTADIWAVCLSCAFAYLSLIWNIPPHISRGGCYGYVNYFSGGWDAGRGRHLRVCNAGNHFMYDGGDHTNCYVGSKAWFYSQLVVETRHIRI